MNGSRLDNLQLEVGDAAFFRAISAFGGGGFLPSDDNPLPPGPWDPVIRNAFRAAVAEQILVQRIRRRVSRAGEEVALNPQPLPPRELYLAALADEIVDRAATQADLLEGTGVAEDRGIIIVGGYVERFVGWCGSEVPILRFPRPKGGGDPDPQPDWALERLDARSLFGMALRMARGARGVQSKIAASTLEAGAKSLALTAFERL